MTQVCIHGFPDEHCASCRTCPHGLTTTRCSRCRTAATSRRTRVAAPIQHPSEDYDGYEIFYVPSLSGWQYRAPDSTPSPESYRSRFLARKAVDDLKSQPPAPSKPARGGKRRTTQGASPA